MKGAKNFLGKSIQIYLKSGKAFNYKVTECGLHHFGGYDNEGLNICIAYEDIDFIIEGGN